MIRRQQRSPLPAVLHIRRVKTVDDGNSGLLRQQIAVADLHNNVFVGAVVNRLTVKADDVDVVRVDSRAVKQFFNDLRVKQRHFAFDLFDPFAVKLRLIAHDGLQFRAHIHIVRAAQSRAFFKNVDPVGHQKRRVHAVKRRPAHQSQRRQRSDRLHTVNSSCL